MERTFPRPAPRFDIGLAAAAAAVAAWLAYVVVRYGTLDGYLDHIEPDMALAAWRVLEGNSLYQDYGEWPFFGYYYGPLSYLVHAGVLAVAGASVPLTKLANAVAVMGGVVVFWLYARRRFGACAASAGVLLYVAFILIFAPVSIWNRPDPFTVLLVAVAIFAGGLPGKWTAPAAIGVCIGLAVNLKIHSFVYFLPVMVDCRGWKDVRAMAVMVGVSLPVFLAPFALEQVSLATFVARMSKQVGGRGIDIEVLSVSLRYSLLFLSPGLLLAGLRLRGRGLIAGRDAVYFAVLAGSVAVLLYPASIPGAGPYHFLPLFPVVVDALLRLGRGFADTPRLHKGVLVVLAVILLALSVPVQRRLMRNLARMEGEAVGREVHEIVERNGNVTLQMGYGDSYANYRLTFHKPILAFAGHPVTVDSHVLMETRFIGIDTTDKVADYLRSCDTRRWLIPKGERPFAMPSYYDGRPLFGAAPTIFQERYEKTASFAYFDLWSCRDE